MTRRQMNKLEDAFGEVVDKARKFLSEELNDLSYNLARFAVYFEDKHLVVTHRVIKKETRI